MSVEVGNPMISRVSAIILVLAGLYVASPVFAPAAFGLFGVALAWPLQRFLETYMPRLVALVLTLCASLVVITGLASMVTWGLARVAQWLIANAGRFQEIYLRKTEILEEQGIVLASLLTENFNVLWVVRVFNEIAGRLNSLAGFTVLTLIFMILGLLEADDLKRRVASSENRARAAQWIEAGTRIMSKLRRYMLVRTMASILTGLVIWGFTLYAGLELATAWGVIAFALNYIPFVGPLVATVFPTLFAFAQFESWQMAILVFGALNLIQFLIGSYLEPRVAGVTLAISPFLVMFSVFFWSFMWGIPGAFIGVPILIVLVTLLESSASGNWMARLMAGQPQT